MNGFISNKDHKAPVREFREHARGRLVCTVHVMLPGRRIVEARAVDISVGGLRLLVPTNLPLHSVHNIRLGLPGNPEGSYTVMARGQVMNVMFSGKENGFMVGLRFTSISHAAVEAIAQYLHERPRYGRHAGAPAHRTPISSRATDEADCVC
jgi:c-di-GMP-binding flagellar brake protein YcgR